MKGLVLQKYGDFANLVPGERTEPQAGPEDIVVEVRATAVNFADTLLVQGLYQFKPALPFIPGKCPAGLVVAVGERVSRFRPGDRVLTLADVGGFGERVAVRETHCFLLPQTLDFAAAASMSSVFDTAWIALRECANVAAGETVLVSGGSSGIGLAAAQLARAFGCRVVSAITSPAKGEAVRDAGADEVIACAGGSPGEDFRYRVLAANGGRAIDAAIDMLGGDMFDQALRTLAWRGRMVVVGFAAGRIPTIKANYLLVKNISVTGMQISDFHRRRPETVARCWAEIFALYEAGRIRPLPGVVWPLARAADALAALRERSAPGRIVLTQGQAA